MPQVFKSRPPSGAKRGKKRKLPDAPLPPLRPLPPPPSSSLWVSKHAPHFVSDLVVHKRKIADVRAWLESRLHDPKHHIPGGQCLLLTGPPGVGKSATISLLAQELGIHFAEWTPPAPTPWHEHLHHAFTGHRYTSKLEEFQGFVEGARKFPALPLSGEGVKGVLVEDLPHVSGGAQTQQLCRVLQELARSVWFVTVVVVTEGAEEGRSGWRETVQAVEAVGATKIAFNPITPPAIKRLLTKIAATEKYRLSSDQITAIAEHSNGDLRHAISSLEFQSTKLHTSLPQKEPLESEKTRTSNKDNTRSSSSSCDTTSSPAYGRDNVFSHYHALGKLLHNKRHLDQPLEAFQEVTPEFLRHPLNMEVPEQILVDAQIEFPTLVAFLHENVLDFIDEDAIDDVAEVLTYLGDADIQLSGRRRHFSSSSFSSSSSSDDTVLGVRAAGSVAARGVLFANAHPAPRKWQSVRAPVLWQVERVLAEKKGSTVPRSQLSWEAPSRSSPPDASEDEPMDDIRSLTADCIVDLDDEMAPHSNPPVHIQCVDRGPSDSVLEDHMEEDEDVIEDDDDD